MPFSVSLRTSALYLTFITMLGILSSVLSIPVWAKEAPNNGATDNISTSPNTSTKQAPLNALPTKVQRANNSNSQLAIYQQLFSLQAQVAKLEAQLNIELKHSSMVEGVKENEDKIVELKLAIHELARKIEFIDEIQSEAIENHGKRIEDIWSGISVSGIVISILAIFAGLSIANRAKSEAREAAQEITEEVANNWLAGKEKKLQEDQGAILSEYKDKFEEQIDELKGKWDNSYSNLELRFNQFLEEKEKEIDASVENRLKTQASMSLEQEKRPEPPTQHQEALSLEEDETLKEVREYLITASKLMDTKNYSEAIQLLANLLTSHPNMPARTKARVMILLGIAHDESGETKTALKTYTAILKEFNPTEDPYVQTNLAQAMFNMGVGFSKVEHKQASIEIYENTFKAFQNNTLPKIRVLMARALYNKANIHLSQKDPQNAITSHTLLIEKFYNSEDENIQEVLIKSLIQKALQEQKLNKFIDSIDTYDSLISKLKALGEVENREKLLSAEFNKAYTLGLNGQIKEELDLYERLVYEIQNIETSNYIQGLHLNILFNKGIRLAELKRLEEAHDDYDKAISVFLPKEKHPPLFIRLMINKAILLKEQKKFESATEVLKKVLEMPDVKGKVTELHADALFEYAHCLTKQNKLVESLQYYDFLIELFRRNQGKFENGFEYQALANAAALSFLLENREGVLQRISQCLRIDRDPENYAVMRALQFLLDDKPLTQLIEAIEKISANYQWTWDFNEIHPYLDKFTGKKRCQIEAIVSFFEEHHDVKRLKSEVEHCEGQEEQAA